ncbi:serpin family protein [Bradyrhizobium sp. 21]|uniref:serpin family protein n=1 Tax=Bradyrhizobium sp. 21 TaxID=2782666 RepID=UPI001FFBCC72|nr:serpin family protein [Bradyrhizobium sp. 21]MCK1385682.1 tetratricopeptide repeat protein [Bradyrhizobium sp. 21]
MTIRQSVLGSTSPAVLPALDALAEHYLRKFRIADAISYRTRGLEIADTIHGPVSSDVAARLLSIGWNCLAMNDLRGAEPLFRRALAIANAFVFKECWKAPFDKSKAANKAFTRVDGSKAQSPTMSLVSDGISWRSSGRFVAVELSYKDEDFALTLVTNEKEPAKLASFREAVSLLAGIDFLDAKVTLSLPKFGGTTDNDLLDVLADMGLKSAMVSSNQFPGLADGLVLGRVRQKTWLSVDEIGTESAAVTAAQVTRSATEGKAVTVTFDKPFIYALRYRPTGTILMGATSAIQTLARAARKIKNDSS